MALFNQGEKSLKIWRKNQKNCVISKIISHRENKDCAYQPRDHILVEA